MNKQVLAVYSDRQTGRVVDQVIRPAPSRLAPCTAGCGKLTRGGGKCFTCETAGQRAK